MTTAVPPFLRAAMAATVAAVASATRFRHGSVPPGFTELFATCERVPNLATVPASPSSYTRGQDDCHDRTDDTARDCIPIRPDPADDVVEVVDRDDTSVVHPPLMTVPASISTVVPPIVVLAVAGDFCSRSLRPPRDIARVSVLSYIDVLTRGLLFHCQHLPIELEDDTSTPDTTNMSGRTSYPFGCTKSGQLAGP